MELTCQDSLSGKLSEIQIYLRLYYLYEKSAKKSRELMDVVDDVKESFNFYLFEHKVIDGSLTGAGDTIHPVLQKGVVWFTRLVQKQG